MEHGTENDGTCNRGVRKSKSKFQSTGWGSLMARLDRSMPVKEIAQIGGAIGREFSYEVIAAVAPIPQAQLDDSLRS